MTSSPKIHKVELWDIDQLIPYDRNNKKHPDEEIARLAANIASTNLDHPLHVMPDGVVITGHGRRLALIKLGWKKVPVVVRHDLSPEQARAMRITDNTLAGTKYDTRAIRDEWAEIFASTEFTLSADDLGISKKEQDLFLALDLTAPVLDVVMDDADAEISRQSDEDRERVELVDGDQVRIHEIFGLKTLSRTDARKITRHLAGIEADTGLKGRDALFAALNLS